MAARVVADPARPDGGSSCDVLQPDLRPGHPLGLVGPRLVDDNSRVAGALAGPFHRGLQPGRDSPPQPGGPDPGFGVWALGMALERPASTRRDLDSRHRPDHRLSGASVGGGHGRRLLFRARRAPRWASPSYHPGSPRSGADPRLCPSPLPEFLWRSAAVVRAVVRAEDRALVSENHEVSAVARFPADDPRTRDADLGLVRSHAVQPSTTR